MIVQEAVCGTLWIICSYQ